MAEYLSLKTIRDVRVWELSPNQTRNNSSSARKEESVDMAKQIMIVDDDKNILDFMHLALAFEGYDVRISTTGRDLPKMRRNELPDLILLDVKLIDEDGRTICRELKSNEQTKDVPIIMLSAHVSERKLRQECPVDDFLPKPFELGTLLNKVEKLLPA
jgi:DNA-binding response OmpR family regulator